MVASYAWYAPDGYGIAGCLNPSGGGYYETLDCAFIGSYTNIHFHVPVVEPTPTVAEIVPSVMRPALLSAMFWYPPALMFGVFATAAAPKATEAPAAAFASEALAAHMFVAAPTVGVCTNWTVEAVASLGVTQMPMICLNRIGPPDMVKRTCP